MDPHRAPRDGDRDMLAEQVWRAHEQGLINATDRDIRLQNVRHARSMTELDLMSRDLAQLQASAAHPTLLQRVRPGAHTAPATGSWDRFDPQARPHTLDGKSSRKRVLLTVLAVVLLVVGFGVAAFVFMVSSVKGAVDDSRSSGSSEAFEGAGRELAPVDEVDYALTAAGLLAFLKAYEEKFGTTLVTDLALFSDSAVVRTPIRGSNLQRGYVLRRTGWTTFGPELDRFPGAKDVDLRGLDIPRLLGNIRVARETLGVADPNATAVFIRNLSSFGGVARVGISVSNASEELAALETTLDGRITRRYPFGG